MKRTLLLSSACLLLGLAACDSITIVGSDSSADGEDVTSDISETSDIAETSSEEIIEEVEITADEADAYLASVDEDEAAAWIDGVTTYAAYTAVGESYTETHIDETEDDRYMYIGQYTVSTDVTTDSTGNTKYEETIAEMYGVFYKNEEGVYIGYTYTVQPYLAEESGEYSEEYAAAYFAANKESVAVVYSYDFFSQQMLNFRWDDLPDVTYSLVGENLKIRGEFADLELGEDEIFSGYQEVVVNPYGYILEYGYDIYESEEEAGVDEMIMTFTPDAEFDRYTPDDIRSWVATEE